MDWFVRAFLKASLTWLAFGVTLGVAMAIHPIWIRYRLAHMHMLLLGFVTMMIYGVAYHVIPRFSGAPLHSRRVAASQWFISNLGLLAMAVGFVARANGAKWAVLALGTGGALSAVGAYLFVYGIWRTIDAGQRRSPAAPFKPESHEKGILALRRRPHVLPILLLTVWVPLREFQAQSPATGTIAPFFCVRSRLEMWDWFATAEADGDYLFNGTLLRGGLSQQRAALGWRLELAAPILIGLPETAIAPAPRGQLGLGATYYASNDGESSVAMIFVKQAFLRLGAPATRGGHSLRLGRFEFAEGAEATVTNATLAALQRDRIAQRLIGPFGWSHAGRSLDGVHYVFDRRGFNVTGVLARPTWGAFQADGWGHLDGVTLGYGAFSMPIRAASSPGVARLFGIHYRDARGLVKTDNRPIATRQTDREAIAITTVGGHVADVLATRMGDVDLLLWGALQRGDWGVQRHRARAAVAEVGVQPNTMTSVRPWLRAGWTVTSGDRNSQDSRHESFMQLLPTPRLYARMPFYNMMNLDDLFLGLTLRPGRRAVIRTEIHRLKLNRTTDLWYSGGGAYQDDSFGFAGRPSNGLRNLGTLLDVSLDLQLSRRLSLGAYAARANGGEVISALHPDGARATFGYFELEYRH